MVLVTRSAQTAAARGEATRRRRLPVNHSVFRLETWWLRMGKLGTEAARQRWTRLDTRCRQRQRRADYGSVNLTGRNGKRCRARRRGPGRGLFQMLADQFRHLEHVDGRLVREHRLQCVVSLDHPLVLRVLKLVLLDVRPQPLGDFSTRDQIGRASCREECRSRWSEYQ